MKRSTQQRSEYDDTDSVNVYMTSLEHPLKPVVEAIRQTILEADSENYRGHQVERPKFLLPWVVCNVSSSSKEWGAIGFTSRRKSPKLPPL